MYQNQILYIFEGSILIWTNFAGIKTNQQSQKKNVVYLQKLKKLSRLNVKKWYFCKDQTYIYFTIVKFNEY